MPIRVELLFMNQENISKVQLRRGCNLAYVRITQEHNLLENGSGLRARRALGCQRQVGHITLRF